MDARSIEPPEQLRLPAATRPPEPPPPPARPLLAVTVKLSTGSGLICTIVDAAAEGYYVRAGVAGVLLVAGVVADRLYRRRLRYSPAPAVAGATTPGSQDER
ncbi:hypothetical protein AB0J72_30660 [Dactylosporangium sp. NPDC049742]|uniref:hypothetical protein n=1 Tax=Dactylosporangium sp. NPDC049742 TaxID=3154737 RepID=UPI003431EFD7